MSALATAPRHEDRGAALILAIGFMLFVGAITASLAFLISSGFANRGTLERVRDREFAADAAIQDAITSVRLVTDRSAEVTCAGQRTTLNGVTIRVDCASAAGLTGGTDNLVLSQRNLIFTACEDTGVPCTEETAVIRAQVNFEQRYGKNVTKTYVQSWSVNK